MERTKYATQSERVTYEINDEPIILSKSISDLFLKEENPADIMALYWFYYYTAKWQRTNRPKATDDYCMNGLHWGYQKFSRAKQKLINLKLISCHVIKNNRGQICEWIITVNFIWKNNTTQQSHYLPPELSKTRTGERKRNALSTNKEKEDIEENFEKFWKLYPKKADKGKALTKWNELMTQKSKQKIRPSFEVIKTAIQAQIKSERWQQPEFIPNPSTWLHQARWLDDPQEMKVYNRNNTNKPDFVINDQNIRFNLCPDGYYRHPRTGETYIQ